MARKKAKALPQPEPEMLTVYGDILQETEDAILVSCDGEEVWLPKSQIEYAGERGDEYVEISLPDWLAEDKGLSDNQGFMPPQTADESPAISIAPCFPRNRETPCEHREWVTQDEIDAEEADFDEHFKHIMAARALIVMDGKQRGSVVCPKCGGKLDYAVSPLNGHIGAACETSNCLNWME